MALLLLCPTRAIPCFTSGVSYRNSSYKSSSLWHFCCCVLQEQFLVVTGILLLLCPTRIVPCGTSVVVSYKSNSLFHFCCCVLQVQFLLSLLLCLTRIVPSLRHFCCVLQEQFIVALLFKCCCHLLCIST